MDIKNNTGGEKMKKVFLKGALMALAGVGLMAGNAMATIMGNGPSLIESAPLSSGQPALQTIVDTVLGAGVVNVNNDQTGVGAWEKAESDVSQYLVSYALAAGNTNYIPGILGIYDLTNTSKTWDLLDTSITTSSNFSINDSGALKVNNLFAETGWSGSFGYYFIQLGTTRYTEDSMNADGQNYAATYRLPSGTTWTSIPYLGTTNGDDGTLDGDNDWLLAFEYNPWVVGVARDFNDGVFIVEDMNPAPIPEPATMLLLGTGLAGLVAARRRRKAAMQS